MSNSSNSEGRRNKNFIINNSILLKEYAITNQENAGTGIIVINLSSIENDLLKPTDLSYEILPASQEDKQSSLKQAIAYIPINNFWFKMIRLKIKKKYDIDIKRDYDLENKFLIIFLKDNSLEHFSIYSIKLK